METAHLYLGPLLEAVWQHLVTSIKYVVENTAPIRKWLSDNVPVYIDMVRE